MRASELIADIPGITMDHLHNWERQGYLAPGRIRQGKKQIRDYTAKEALLVKAMWFYYQKGLSPRNAYRNAAEELSKSAPVIFPPSSDNRAGHEVLEKKDEAIACSAIFELAIPLRHYFRIKTSEQEKQWAWRKVRSCA